MKSNDCGIFRHEVGSLVRTFLSVGSKINPADTKPVRALKFRNVGDLTRVLSLRNIIQTGDQRLLLYSHLILMTCKSLEVGTPVKKIYRHYALNFGSKYRQRRGRDI